MSLAGRVRAGRIAILMYHSLDDSGSVVSVSPRLFAEQMAALADAGFRGVALRDAVAERERTGRWPEGCVVLTFDDGFANFVEHGAPLLARLGFGATVFVVSGHVGGFNDWAPSPAGLGRRPMLTAREVEELAAAGVEIGAHTRTHADLSRLAGESAEREIVESRRELEQLAGRTVASFAYPYGRSSAAARAIVGRTFGAACTTRLGRAGDEPSTELSRVDSYYLRDASSAARCAAGRLDAYLAVRRLGRGMRRGLNGLRTA